MRITEWAALCALSVAGCVSHSIGEDVDSVRTTLRSRAPELHAPDREAWAQTPRELPGLLARPLTANDAVRIALLSNRDVRASLLELGVARGELVSAGLLSNPTLEAEVRVPEDQAQPPQFDIGLAFDLTQIILAPVRQDAARARLEAARYRTAAAILDLAYRVRVAFLRYQASMQTLELRRTAMASYEASAEAVRALFAAGNVRELDVAMEEAAYEESRIAVARAELAMLDDRERVNVLLGLYGRNLGWQAVPRLMDPPPHPIETARLERRAIERSLDLAWMRAELDAIGRSIGAAQAEGLVPDIEIGVHAEFDETRWELGPEIAIGIPIFSQNQGAVLSRQAQLDVLRERYVGTAIAVRASVRAARNRAVTTELLARRIRTVLLPARTRVFEQTLRQYNAMQVDIFRLLAAKREEIEAAQQYIDALRDYWIARATLAQVLSGRMAGLDSSAEPVARTSPRSESAH